MMMTTYFILLALFWVAGLLIWKKLYVTEKREEDK